MKVEVDTGVLEKALLDRLQQSSEDVFATELCGREVTCADLIRDLESGTPFAEGLLAAIVNSNTRLWVVREGQ